MGLHRSYFNTGLLSFKRADSPQYECVRLLPQTIAIAAIGLHHWLLLRGYKAMPGFESLESNVFTRGVWKRVVVSSTLPRAVGKSESCCVLADAECAPSLSEDI